jgi:hypothetical protein
MRTREASHQPYIKRKAWLPQRLPRKTAATRKLPLTSSFLVELVRRYSNRADLLERLMDTRSRTRQRGGEDPDSRLVTVSGRTSGVWRVRDRLTDADVHVLIADFLAGTSKGELADRYDVSFSTVKNILRKHGVRRTS